MLIQIHVIHFIISVSTYHIDYGIPKVLDLHHLLLRNSPIIFRCIYLIFAYKEYLSLVQRYIEIVCQYWGSSIPIKAFEHVIFQMFLLKK